MKFKYNLRMRCGRNMTEGEKSPRQQVHNTIMSTCTWKLIRQAENFQAYCATINKDNPNDPWKILFIFYFIFLRTPQQMLRTHRSLEAYYATLWWRWLIFSFFLVMEHRSNAGENRSTRGKTCPNANLSTTNPTRTDPGSNPGLRGERPATNLLSHGNAFTSSSFDFTFIPTAHRDRTRRSTTPSYSLPHSSARTLFLQLLRLHCLLTFHWLYHTRRCSDHRKWYLSRRCDWVAVAGGRLDQQTLTSTYPLSSPSPHALFL
jgi:hypothetical protein